MNYELRIMSFKNSYRLQSYDFFCKYANFGVSLQHIKVEIQNYISLPQKNAKIFNIAVVNRIGSASNG